MARKIGNALNLQQNELQNPRLHNLASDPPSPVAGQIWFDATVGRFKYRGNSATVDPSDRATHSGTQAASTISDFAAAARAAVAGTDLAMGGAKITGLANGTSAQDAVTKAQLDAVQNGTDWKASVRVASTANLAALSGLLTVDGVTLLAGDRVLVKDQATASQNGIWVAASGAWARAADASQGTLTADAAVFVEEGTQADTQWRLTTNDPITVGTTALAFSQIGAGTSYAQGAGVSIVGNTISLDTAVAVRKYAATVGGTTSIAVTHNLGTRDVTVAIFDAATYEEIDCDVIHTDVNTVTLGFSVAPSASSLRCVVHG